MFASYAQKGIVYEVIKVNGDGIIKRRLLDMGFTPKTKIKIICIAPLNKTFLVLLRGFYVALRKDAVEMIEVAREKV